MSKRFVVKVVAAVALTLAVLCATGAPAQAAPRNPGSLGVSIWSSFVDYLAHVFAGPPARPQAEQRKTTTTTGGGTPNATCPPGSVGCNNDQSDTGTGIDPLGKT